MGLFNMFKNNGGATPQNSVPTSTPTVQQNAAPILNLTKGQVLDLTKYSTSLSEVHIGAGWDVNKHGGGDYDLDLCAYLCNDEGKVVKQVYYGSKKAQGIYLDGDNLTGEGDGDDENIFITLNQLPSSVSKIVIGVVIYQGKSRRQKFSHVRNAYVRLTDEGKGGQEICRYQLSEDGGDNTAVAFASLTKIGGAWNFNAIGKYSQDTIESLSRSL